MRRSPTIEQAELALLPVAAQGVVAADAQLAAHARPARDRVLPPHIDRVPLIEIRVELLAGQLVVLPRVAEGIRRPAGEAARAAPLHEQVDAGRASGQRVFPGAIARRHDDAAVDDAELAVGQPQPPFVVSPIERGLPARGRA